jgi:predicted dithiol-disulfide oxidoreductase (DUF899 family)
MEYEAEYYQRCQRCGIMADDWLCWAHMDEYDAQLAAEAKTPQWTARTTELHDQFMDAELRKAEAAARRSGRF